MQLSTFVLNVLKTFEYRSQVPVLGRYQPYFKVLVLIMADNSSLRYTKQRINLC